MVAWNSGVSEEAAAEAVVRQTRRRTAGEAGIVWVSDGHGAYEKWIRLVYRAPVHTGRPGRPRLEPTPGVGLTQIIKTREQGRVVAVRVRHCFGPKPTGAYTVHVERRNGVLRDRVNCLTRKTHGFAKREATWDAAVTLSLFEENWMRAHPALRVRQAGLPQGRRYQKRSPAMALELTDHVWSWLEFLTLPTFVNA